jgi:hypothetical protein
MIINVINENVFGTHCKHIAYAVDMEGQNSGGFAAVVAAIIPGTAYIGKHPLGTTLSVKVGKKTYHALVCRSVKSGWDKTPQAIVECLDKIDIPDEEPIAVVLPGGSMSAQIYTGADVRANTEALHTSKKSIIVYTLDYAKSAFIEVLNSARKEHTLSL